MVSTSQPLLLPKIDPTVFEQASNALYTNQWLEVDYQNAAGKQTTARVMPLTLTRKGSCKYLVYRFDGYDNERSIALHRILFASAMAFTFERQKDFNLKQ